MSRHGIVENAHVKWTLLEAPHFAHTDPVGRRKFHALARCEPLDGATWVPYVVTVEFFEDHLPPKVATPEAAPAPTVAAPKAKKKKGRKS